MSASLLSGLGFESGGLAAAHGFAQSFTALPATHADYLHGEMVAMGTLAQVVLESRVDEAGRVAAFLARVGLPVQLGQLAVDPGDTDARTRSTPSSTASWGSRSSATCRRR